LLLTAADIGLAYADVMAEERAQSSAAFDYRTFWVSLNGIKLRANSTAEKQKWNIVPRLRLHILDNYVHAYNKIYRLKSLIYTIKKQPSLWNLDCCTCHGYSIFYRKKSSMA
jgi:hypothetical protein